VTEPCVHRVRERLHAGLLGVVLLMPAAAAAQATAPARPATPAAIAVPVLRPLAAAVPGIALVTPAVAAASPSAAVAPAQPPVRVLLVPARETTVVSQMVGRVETVVGELGASFREGEPLVVFECGEQHARLKIAEAEHDAARQQHVTKLRLHGLDAAGGAEVQLAATAVARASAQIELSTQQRAMCRIDAPFAGRVVKLHVRAYQGVAVGQPLIDSFT